MAKIPRTPIGSKQLSNPKVSTQSPSALQTQSTGVGRGLESLGSTIQREAEAAYKKMDEARNYTETLRAKREYMEGASQITTDELTAKNKNDDLKTGAEEDYAAPRQKLKALEESVLGKFTNKDNRAKFQADMGLIAMSTENDWRKIYRKNSIRNGREEIKRNSDAIAQNYAATGKAHNRAGKEVTIEEALKEEWDDGVNRGFFDAGVAYSHSQTTEKAARMGRFNYDLINNFKDVQDNLDGNTYGFDTEGLKKAKSTFRTEQSAIRGQEQEVLDEMLEAKTLTEDILKVKKDNKFIDQKMFNEYRDAMATEDAIDDPATYTLLMEKATAIAKHGSNVGTEDGIWRSKAERSEAFKQASLFRLEVLENKRLKLLSDKERDNLLKKTKSAFAGYKLYSDGITKLKNFTNVYASTERAEIKIRMYKEFMRKIDNGVDPILALQEVIKERLSQEIDTVASTEPEVGLPTDVTEENIKHTMKKRGMTRKQVLELFTPKGKK